MIDIMRTVCEITRWAPCYDRHYENCMGDYQVDPLL